MICAMDDGRHFAAYNTVTEELLNSDLDFRGMLLHDLRVMHAHKTRHIRHRPRFAVRLKK
jgi:hypothetical protein